MSSSVLDRRAHGVVCDICGIPLDAEFFDNSAIFAVPATGGNFALATFELPPQYCGVLRYFAQFAQRADDTQVIGETPGVSWSVLSNGHPLYPYTGFDRILNPWGEGSFPVAIRLDDGARIELVARVMPQTDSVTRLGGRIVGRYWYNPIYGEAVPPRA